MPTSITVPVSERTKSVQFGAPYSAALTLNPDKKLQFGCSGVLSGMAITVNTAPNPDEVTVDPGAFIQDGIIVNITSAQVVEMPVSPSFPVYLVAQTSNETFNSSVQILFTSAPPPSSAVIAIWPDAPSYPSSPTIPTSLSNCELRDAIDLISSLVIQRERLIAGAGQTLFTLPPTKAYVPGANKLWVFRNGKKLDAFNDYAETSPTQVTLNFGATLGDILEFMVLKSAPPITSVALTDLTDVTTDLANAIKDVSALRVSTATSANPLATMADVTAASGLLGTALIGSSIITTNAGGMVLNTFSLTTTLSSIAVLPAMDYTFTTSRWGSRRSVFGFSSAQGKVFIDQRVLNTDYRITIDPRESGSYVLLGATDGAEAATLTPTGVTTRYFKADGRENLRNWTVATFVWLFKGT